MLKTIVRKGDESKHLYIMRGCPGAGKSFVAKELGASTGGIILSTDDFFTDENGVYKWNMNLIGAAHKWNQKRATQALDNSAPSVIIDNTNTVVKEVKPYVEAAVRNNYTISVVEPNTAWARDATTLFAKNSHNVPLATIEKMLARLKPHHEFCEDLRKAM